MGNIYNEDCLEAMKEMPDKYFDLAIVDPPYFEGSGDPKFYHPRMAKSTAIKPITSDWRVPGPLYFSELYRVSANQIIWGCNYYYKHINGAGIIVWDKEMSGDFSDAELASCSVGRRVRMFRYRWNGMIQKDMKNKEVRFHPTQKPVAIYKWLLKNYAKEGDKILDTHGGSMSSVIACIDMGFDYMAFEIDTDYFEDAQKRIDNHVRQLDFTRPEYNQTKMEL